MIMMIMMMIMIRRARLELVTEQLSIDQYVDAWSSEITADYGRGINRKLATNVNALT